MQPAAIADDRAGNVYVADAGDHTISRVAVDGRVTKLAGPSGLFGSADGAGPNARFNKPAGIAVDAVGNVYVADSGNSTLRKIDTAGNVSTIAGVAGQRGLTNGEGPLARLVEPSSIAVDGTGNLYFVDTRRDPDGSVLTVVRKRSPDGAISTFAGNPDAQALYRGLAAMSTKFIGNLKVATDAKGNVFVMEGDPSFDIGTIRKFDGAGRPLSNSSADPYGVRDISVDADGTTYVVENGWDIAGGSAGFSNTFSVRYHFVVRASPDGSSVTTMASFDDPTLVAAGPEGRIVIGDSQAQLSVVDAGTKGVTRLAGSAPGTSAGEAGVTARFDSLAQVTVASKDSFYAKSIDALDNRTFNFEGGLLKVYVAGLGRFRLRASPSRS